MTIWLLGLLLATGPAHGGSVVTPATDELQVEASGQSLVQDAFAALGGGRFDQAAELWGSLADAGAGPDARFWQGLALYEAGRLRDADRALLGLTAPEARNLAALVHLDAGRQAEGLAMLQALSQEPLSDRIAAHVALNAGLARLDQGRLDSAEAAIRKARALATGLAPEEQQALLQATEESLAVVALLRGSGERSAASGLLSSVGDALRQGDHARAEAALSAAPTTLWPRQEVERLLATSAVRRAAGQLPQALEASDAALAVARRGGMGRETAQALMSAAVVHSLAGRHSLALDQLEEAGDTASAGGFRVLEVDARCNQGLVALRLGDTARAQVQVDRVAGRLGEMQYPEGQARLDELQGVLAAARGDAQLASRELQEALRWHEARDHHADAARLATALVSATAGVDDEAADRWAKRAARDFRRAGDPLGEAHIALARGLALVRQSDLTGALAAFGAAATAARADDVPGGEAVAAVAEANAASALMVLGVSAEAAAQAAALGLEGALAHHRQLQAAMADYDRGMTAYDQARFSEAQGRFAQAAAAFEALAEDAYAERAHRARLWSAYNGAVPLAPAQAWPVYSALQPEAEARGDAELAARVVVASALSAHALGLQDAQERLVAASGLAESSGHPDLAARCHAALAEHSLGLEERARHARLALALDPDAAGSVYALYSVAVDAYNAGELALAAGLAEEALPRAGTLEPGLQAVLDASRAP